MIWWYVVLHWLLLHVLQHGLYFLSFLDILLDLGREETVIFDYLQSTSILFHTLEFLCGWLVLSYERSQNSDFLIQVHHKVKVELFGQTKLVEIVIQAFFWNAHDFGCVLQASLSSFIIQPVVYGSPFLNTFNYFPNSAFLVPFLPRVIGCEWTAALSIRILGYFSVSEHYDWRKKEMCTYDSILRQFDVDSDCRIVDTILVLCNLTESFLKSLNWLCQINVLSISRDLMFNTCWVKVGLAVKN